MAAKKRRALGAGLDSLIASVDLGGERQKTQQSTEEQ